MTRAGAKFTCVIEPGPDPIEFFWPELELELNKDDFPEPRPGKNCSSESEPESRKNYSRESISKLLARAGVEAKFKCAPERFQIPGS